MKSNILEGKNAQSSATSLQSFVKVQTPRKEASQSIHSDTVRVQTLRKQPSQYIQTAKVLKGEYSCNPPNNSINIISKILHNRNSEAFVVNETIQKDIASKRYVAESTSDVEVTGCSSALITVQQDKFQRECTAVEDGKVLRKQSALLPNESKIVWLTTINIF